MKTISSSMGVRDWLSLLVLSILWGGSFFFVELAVAELPPLTVVFFRVFLAAIALWMIVLLMKLEIPKSRPIWRRFIFMGILNNVLPFSFIVWGQVYISSSLASILNATTPIFTVLVAGALLADEKVTGNKLFGVLLGFVGTVVMIGPSALSGLNMNVLAQLSVLTAALSYAFAGVYGRCFRKLGVNSIVTSAGQVTSSAILLFPIVLFVDLKHIVSIPDPSVLLSLVALAVLSTAVAYVLYFRILASAGATNLLLVTFLIPVTTILLGMAFLSEVLKVSQVFGMVIVAFGLLSIDGRIVKLIRTTGK